MDDRSFLSRSLSGAFLRIGRIRTCTEKNRRETHLKPGDNYLNPCRGAERTFRSKWTLLLLLLWLVFQRAWFNHWRPPQLQEASCRCVPAAHSVRFSQKVPLCAGPMRFPPSANKRSAASTRRWRKRRRRRGGEREREEKKRRVGENKKRGEKNVGYARLIFRASEECAEAPLVSPFSVSVPMKRDGEVAGLGFLRSFS